jgi:hypothetical protein
MLGEKLSGCYRGKVIDNADPEDLMRLRVQVPQLLGQAVTDWAWPSIPEAVGVIAPSVGDPVWVMFEAGNIERPVWIGVWRTHRPAGADINVNFGGVVAETTFGLAPSNGNTTTLARSDHTHGSPTNPVPAHVADPDPHPQYLTAPEGVHTHDEYATDADLTVHINSEDPHPNAVMGGGGADETLIWMIVNP